MPTNPKVKEALLEVAATTDGFHLVIDALKARRAQTEGKRVTVCSAGLMSIFPEVPIPRPPFRQERSLRQNNRMP